jgi:hypothetical protein
MGLVGAGNNPQVLMTVAVAVAIEEASKYSLICKAFVGSIHESTAGHS